VRYDNNQYGIFPSSVILRSKVLYEFFYPAKEKIMKKIIAITLLIVSFSGSLSAQEVKKTAAVIAEGTFVAGYIDNGAFLNFTGPSLRIVQKPAWALSLGMLPGLRVKKDNAVSPAKKNSSIWPSLGAGLTYTFGHMALQLPLYYNTKTTTTDGKWVIGLGIGYKF